jgi:hypothetical protein
MHACMLSQAHTQRSSGLGDILPDGHALQVPIPITEPFRVVLSHMRDRLYTTREVSDLNLDQLS